MSSYSVFPQGQGYTPPNLTTAKNVQASTGSTLLPQKGDSVDWQKVGAIGAGVALLGVGGKMLHGRSLNLFEDGVSTSMKSLESKVDDLERNLSEKADELEKVLEKNKKPEGGKGKKDFKADADVEEKSSEPLTWGKVADFVKHPFGKVPPTERRYIPVGFKDKGIRYNAGKGIYEMKNAKGKSKMVEPATKDLTEAIYNASASQGRFNLEEAIEKISKAHDVEITQQGKNALIVTNKDGISTYVPLKLYFTHGEMTDLVKKGLFVLPEDKKIRSYLWNKLFRIPEGGFPMQISDHDQLPGFLVPIS
jgi:hypothetical protein